MVGLQPLTVLQLLRLRAFGAVSQSRGVSRHKPVTAMTDVRDCGLDSLSGGLSSIVCRAILARANMVSPAMEL